MLNAHSNWFSLICWLGMVLLCAAILWASEHEEQVRSFALHLIDKASNMLPPKGDDFDYF